MKYISFIFTCGGDAGFRLANCPQWHSGEGRLLFDADKWSVESIEESLKVLKADIRRKQAYCHGFSDLIDNAYKYLVPYVKNTDGVYSDDSYIQSDKLKGWTVCKNTEKCIVPAETDEIVPWEKDGKQFCNIQ